MLASAPHGSAQTYVYSNGEYCTFTRWEENEKNLYNTLIKEWQNISYLLFSGQAVWADLNKTSSQRQNAVIVWKSSLFADNRRLAFLKQLDEGFVDNFGKESKGLKYNKKKVNINLSILYAPERYMRYAAKLQRSMQKNTSTRLVYWLFAFVYSGYMWMVYDLKNIFRKRRS